MKKKANKLILLGFLIKKKVNKIIILSKYKINKANWKIS